MHINCLIQFESNYYTDHKIDRPISYYPSVVLYVIYLVIYNDKIILDSKIGIHF